MPVEGVPIGCHLIARPNHRRRQENGVPVRPPGRRLSPCGTTDSVGSAAVDDVASIRRPPCSRRLLRRAMRPPARPPAHLRVMATTATRGRSSARGRPSSCLVAAHNCPVLSDSCTHAADLAGAQRALAHGEHAADPRRHGGTQRCDSVAAVRPQGSLGSCGHRPLADPCPATHSALGCAS